MSYLAGSRPRAVDLTDLGGGLGKRPEIECEVLTVRLPGGADAAIGRADRLLGVEKLCRVEQNGRRPNVRQLPARAPAMPVEPHLRGSCAIAHGARDVVVARVAPRPDTRTLHD